MIVDGKDVEPLEDICVHCSRECDKKFINGQILSGDFFSEYIIKCPRFKSGDGITEVATAPIDAEYVNV